MTTPESRDEGGEGGGQAGEAPEPHATPLLPAPGARGHWWIAAVTLLAAAAALVWRCG